MRDRFPLGGRRSTYPLPINVQTNRATSIRPPRPRGLSGFALASHGCAIERTDGSIPLRGSSFFRFPIILSWTKGGVRPSAEG